MIYIFQWTAYHYLQPGRSVNVYTGAHGILPISSTIAWFRPINHLGSVAAMVFFVLPRLSSERLISHPKVCKFKSMQRPHGPRATGGNAEASAFRSIFAVTVRDINVATFCQTPQQTHHHHCDHDLPHYHVTNIFAITRIVV